MTTNPYSVNDSNDSLSMSEPVVAYGLSQDAASLKLEAINELMHIFDAGRLSQALDFLRLLGKEEGKGTCSPCQFTAEELRDGVRLAMEQSRQGLGITQEEMRNRKRPWKKI